MWLIRKLFTKIISKFARSRFICFGHVSPAEERELSLIIKLFSTLPPQSNGEIMYTRNTVNEQRWNKAGISSRRWRGSTRESPGQVPNLVSKPLSKWHIQFSAKLCTSHLLRHSHHHPNDRCHLLRVEYYAGVGYSLLQKYATTNTVCIEPWKFSTCLIDYKKEVDYGINLFLCLVPCNSTQLLIYCR